MSSFSNISKREKNLLLLVFVLLVFYFSYTFLLQPANAERLQLEEEMTQLQNDISRANALIGKAPELEQQLEQQRKEISDKYTVYLNSIDQEEILAKLGQLAQAANLTIYSYEATEPMAISVPIEQGGYQDLSYPLLDLARGINPSLPQDQSQQSTEELQSPSEDLLASQYITLGFENATYTSIHQFIRSVENLDKSIQVRTLQLESNSSLLRGVISVVVFRLPSVDPDQESDYPLIAIAPRGKVHPFE